MASKVVKALVFAILSACLALAALAYDNSYILKSFYSGVSLTLLYVVFKLLLEEAIARRITEAATKYSFRRTVSSFFYLVTALVIITIWVEAQNLIVAYGLVGAGLAVALQDVFKNLAGGLVVFLRGTYRVGDRVEVNSKMGDVIDIDLLSTTLLEIGEWVTGDQPTGRLCIIPNGLVLSHSVHNYTKDHQFIWDEISIPLTYSSNWRLASEILLGLVSRETQNATRLAQSSISSLSSRYFLPDRAEVPYVFVSLTDNWINFTVRYVTDVRDRRVIKDRLSRIILSEIEKAGKGEIEISSATLSVGVSMIGGDTRTRENRDSGRAGQSN